MDIIKFLSAFGLGAIVSAFIQAWMANKFYISKRNFDEKKEAYIGFLDAIHANEIGNCNKSALHVGHWHNRIELVGSKRVIIACYKIRETNPINNDIHPDRPKALEELKDAIRADLGVV